LDQLNQEAQAAIGDLSTILTELDSIAPLDEPQVIEARRLLSAGHAFDVGGYRGKSRYRLDEIAGEFKRRSDYWQTCAAAIQALHDVQEPVLQSSNGASHERDNTHETLEEVSRWLRQNRDWPPTSITLEDERREIEDIDLEWKKVKGKRTRAISLVQELGRLSARYQTLAQKIRRAADRADTQMVQVEEIEAEIAELAQIWENQWYQHQDNPTASQEIRDLLNSLDHEQASLRKKYKKKSINQGQVLEALKALQRQVKFFQAALDEDHALDADGHINTRR
jgi:chromosome segregation ATPase